MRANSIATGKGVIVANEGMDALAGNPDLQRADGSHVVIDAPDYTADQGNDETFEDAASVAAQGLIVYQYSKALPFSNVSPGCTFTIKGDAPDASLVDLCEIDTPILSLSQVIAGIDNAVTTVHADVISESFGSTSLPTSRSGALLAAGRQRGRCRGRDRRGILRRQRASGHHDHRCRRPRGDRGRRGGQPPHHGAERRLPSYVSNNMAAQSSGATAPTGKVVDLVASDWFGGETDCAPLINGCPDNYPMEVAAGTSEAAPLIAGAAADVIQAYRADAQRGQPDARDDQGNPDGHRYQHRRASRPARRGPAQRLRGGQGCAADAGHHDATARATHPA